MFSYLQKAQKDQYEVVVANSYDVIQIRKHFDKLWERIMECRKKATEDISRKNAANAADEAAEEMQENQHIRKKIKLYRN